MLLSAQLLAGVGFGAETPPAKGLASWYGEEHRGKLMANGRRFNPDKLTAASWFYPLGTKVRVTLSENEQPARSVLVTITDRGPARELVRDGRIIDLTHAAFRRLARPSRGLATISLEIIQTSAPQSSSAEAAQTAPPIPVAATNTKLEVCQVAAQSSPSQ